MPQYQCLKCCSCHVFQAKQVTKNSKFSCSSCGTKQTVQHVFAISDHPKDIRMHVQKLNMARGTAEEQKLDMALVLHEQRVNDVEYGPDDVSHVLDQDQPGYANCGLQLHAQSTWNQYLTEECEQDAGPDELDDDDPMFVTHIQDKAARGGARGQRDVRGGGRGGRDAQGEGREGQPRDAPWLGDRNMTQGKGGFGARGGLQAQHKQQPWSQQQGVVRRRRDYDGTEGGAVFVSGGGHRGGIQSDRVCDTMHPPAKYQATSAGWQQQSSFELPVQHIPSSGTWQAGGMSRQGSAVGPSHPYRPASAHQPQTTQATATTLGVEGFKKWTSQAHTQEGQNMRVSGYQAPTRPTVHHLPAQLHTATTASGNWTRTQPGMAQHPGPGVAVQRPKAAAATGSMWGDYLDDDDADWNGRGCNAGWDGGDEAGFVTAL